MEPRGGISFNNQIAFYDSREKAQRNDGASVQYFLTKSFKGEDPLTKGSKPHFLFT